MILYGGVVLADHDGPQALADAWLAESVEPFDGPPAVPKRTGVLYWPRGAAKWARGYFLATQAELDAVRALAFAGGVYQPLPLTLSDGVLSLTTSLWLQAARRLTAVAGANPLYLLCLCDDRWFWRDRAGVVGVVPGTTTWAGLFTQIGAALGVSLSVDAVPAAYLKPGAELSSPDGQGLAVLLDSAAAAAGMRVARGLDGSVRVMGPASAAAAFAANTAGAAFALDGGPLSPAAAGAFVPAAVEVSFPRTNSGVPDGTRTAYVVTLASLALPQYAGVTGYSGTRVLRSTAAANWTGGGAPANDAELAALANQAAADFYLWAAAGAVDQKWSGYPAWQAEAVTELVTYAHCTSRTEANDLSTRAMTWDDDDASPLPAYGSAGGVSNYFAGPVYFAGPAYFGGPVTVANSTTTITNETVNLSNTVFNFLTDNTWTLTALTTLTIGGSGYVSFTAPLEICGYQFWCCQTWTLPASNNLDLPGPGVVFVVETTGTITGIKPQAFGDAVNTGDISAATNASPIVLTVPGWTVQPQVGQAVKVTGVLGNTAANSTATVQAVDATHVTLQNTTGNGAFAASAGSKVQLAGGQLIVLVNASGGTLALSNLDASSDPANRFELPPAYGSTLTLADGDTITLWWDDCVDYNWKVIACTVAPPVTTTATGQYAFANVATTSLYPAAVDISASAGGSITPGTNTLIAFPFLWGMGGHTLDELVFRVTTAVAAGKARMGVYNNSSASSLLPTTLLIDGGEMDASTTGDKVASIAQALTAGKVYWFAFLCNSNTIAVAGFSNSNFLSLLGFGTTTGTGQSGYTVAQTYGALPGNFPASPSKYSQTSIPALYGRFSA